MTAVDLRQATVGYPEAAVRAAVTAGLLECPLPDEPADPEFAAMITVWLLDPSPGWERFPPPLPVNTIAAIDLRLLASSTEAARRVRVRTEAAVTRPPMRLAFARWRVYSSTTATAPPCHARLNPN
jgi:hypothetical protein